MSAKGSEPYFENCAKKLFGLDIRALALLRVSTATIVLIQTIGYFPQIDVRTVILSILSFIAALFLLIGYQTRRASFATWIFILFLQNLTSATRPNDLVLRLILLWGAFLPWGSTYSIDRAWNPPLPSDKTHHVFSAASMAYIFQVFFWFLALFQGPNALPWMLVVGILGILPTSIFDRLGEIFYKPKNFHVYFDQDCGFCKKAISILKTFLFISDDNIAPAQSNFLIEKQMQAQNSWVAEDENKNLFYKVDAMNVLISHSPIFWPFKIFLLIPGIRRMGIRVYDLIAASRVTACSILPRQFAQKNLIFQLTDGEFLFCLFSLLYALSRTLGSFFAAYANHGLPDAFGTFFGF